jgi:hypothetical protein
MKWDKIFFVSVINNGNSSIQDVFESPECFYIPGHYLTTAFHQFKN